jgi:NAD(P)H dehydrogenase (quinone)
VKEIIVVYESWSGNVAKMAQAVAEGVARAGYAPVLTEAADAKNERITEAAGLIVGSVTSYGQMAGAVKSFFDRSPHGAWRGKPAGAFASSGILGGGSETAVLSMNQALLIHGCVIQGDVEGPHYGPVCLGAPDETALTHCRNLGERVARLATAFAGNL